MNEEETLPAKKNCNKISFRKKKKQNKKERKRSREKLSCYYKSVIGNNKGPSRKPANNCFA